MSPEEAQGLLLSLAEEALSGRPGPGNVRE